MVEFKAAATSRPRTRQSEDLETEEQLGYEPGKIYVILADTRDYSEGFCLAKCVKPNVDSFLGNYLEKSVVAGTDVLFNVTSYRANFEAETVFSTILSITSESNGGYSVSQSEINDIIFSINSLL